MTDIVLLPVRTHGSSQYSRLRADLAAAHARGEDLGSRAPHIQAGGERLLELSCALERAIQDLGLTLEGLGLKDAATLEALRGIASSVEGLANTAQRFRPSL